MLMQLGIPLPNLDQQKTLERAFDRIEATRIRSAIKDLDHLVPAMLNQAFGM
jgi:hypothetical protein